MNFFLSYLKILTVVICCGATTFLKGETLLKMNAAYVLGGVLNPAVEIGVAKNFTIQLEGVASFYESITILPKFKNMPLKFCLGFLEMHWFPKERFKGFYLGPTLGYGSYKLQKWNYWGTNKVQYGTSFFLGAVLGWQWQVKRWSFDLFVGGGWQHGFYEGYDTVTGERYDLGGFSGRFNKSAEWIPFKGGLMIGYRF